MKKRWTLKDKIDRAIKSRNENTGYSLDASELAEIERKKRILKLNERFESLLQGSNR